MRREREDRGEVAPLSAVRDGFDAEAALPIIGEAQKRVCEERAPARDHWLSRLRLGGVDEGQDLPQDDQRQEDRDGYGQVAPAGERGHAALSLCAGRPAARPARSRPRCPSSLCLIATMSGGFSVEQVRELFEAIAGVERNAAELAAERMTEREFEKLQRLHERMARHHAAGERQPYFRLNQEIHLAIVAAAKNATLQAIHASLISRARRARYEALASQARWIEAMEEHERLMAALADRNGALAGAIMQKHDLGTAASMVAALEKAPSLASLAAAPER